MELAQHLHRSQGDFFHTGRADVGVKLESHRLEALRYRVRTRTRIADGRIDHSLPREVAMADLGTCRVCGTGLQLEECWNCDGTGEIRSWLILHKTCPSCRGTGERARCPNWANHWSLHQPVGDPVEELKRRQRDEAIKAGGYEALRKRMQGPPPPPPPPPSPPWWRR
jgi:hypothetical protein